MKSTILTIIVIFSCFISAYSQRITGKILSAQQQVLGFARIGVLNQTFGAVADKNGVYSLDLTNISKDSNLVVEYGGYETWTQPVGVFINSSNHNIVLQPRKAEMEDVVVTSNTAYENKNWGIRKKGNALSISVSGNEADKDSSKEFALEFNNKKKVRIMKIHLNLFPLSPNDTLYLNFDVLGKKGGEPSGSIISQNITDTVTASKLIDDTYSLGLSGQNIIINKQDFFVSVKVLNSKSGRLSLHGALFRKFYYRNFFGKWKKLSIAAPSLNIDVKVAK